MPNQGTKTGRQGDPTLYVVPATVDSVTEDPDSNNVTVVLSFNDAAFELTSPDYVQYMKGMSVDCLTQFTVQASIKMEDLKINNARFKDVNRMTKIKLR